MTLTRKRSASLQVNVLIYQVTDLELGYLICSYFSNYAV
jgi:hypothetical protein